MGEMRGQVTLSYISFYNCRELFPDWGEICRVFANKKYSVDDEDYEVFFKIKKFELYKIETRPQIMPSDNATRWEFESIDVQHISIINRDGNVVTSLRVDDFN